MKTLIVVNGAYDWRPHFAAWDVHQVWVQRSEWSMSGGRLRVRDQRGVHEPDVILWRLGAIDPDPTHRAILELIRLSGLPCVNSASCLLRGYDRLSMLCELREAGASVIDFDVAIGGAIDELPESSPAVFKIGNLHGGQGKARAMDDRSWRELANLAGVATDYVTVEPFIDYVRDIRCMAVGERIWAMSRRGRSWRANVQTRATDLIEPPREMATQTHAIMAHLGADVLGIDFLERADGSFVVLESNDIPGVLGWPRSVIEAIAERVIGESVR